MKSKENHKLFPKCEALHHVLCKTLFTPLIKGRKLYWVAKHFAACRIAPLQQAQPRQYQINVIPNAFMRNNIFEVLLVTKMFSLLSPSEASSVF